MMGTAHTYRIRNKLGNLRTVLMAIALVMPCGALALGNAPRAVGGAKLTDQDITDAIETELLLDPAVRSYHVDVGSVDGAVTLAGWVDNLTAKERAAKIASTVKGVRTVVNRIEVRAEERNDKAIRRDVERALLMDPATDSFEIGVAVEEGRVTLNGNVQSWQEKDLAGKVAKSVRGVRALDNQIIIEYTTNRPDPEIKSDIAAALKWDRFVDAGLIDVQVNDGKARLSGTVGSSAEKNRAYTTAWVAGVRGVDTSKLKVKAWARDADQRKDSYVDITDDRIREAIQDGLKIDPRVLSFNVQPYVTNGVVTLRGTVDNLKAKKAAANTARNTVGVWQVKNRLKVRPQALDDDTISSRVANALRRDPYVERHEIKLTTIGGLVYLDGTVDSYFEKAQAEDVASRVNGVVDVRNNLDVSYHKPSEFTYDPYLDDWYPYDFDWYDYDVAYRTTKSDSSIEEKIEEEFWWSPFVDADQVNVTVNGGVATLTGTVDSWSELNAARENALEGGAISVINDLDVKLDS